MPHLHFHDDKLRCPYHGCGKSFEKPSILTDSTTMPRETYYACPYCQSKLDILVEDLKIVGVRPTEYPKVFESPAKCSRHFGFLNSASGSLPIPDECLLCPKVLQCSVRRERK